MNVRARVVLAAALAVAAGIVVSCTAVYFIVRLELRHRLDAGLRSAAARVVVRESPDGRRFVVRNALGGLAWHVQLVGADGTVTRQRGSTSSLPVTSQARAVAAGRSGAVFSDARLGREHVRILTTQLVAGTALQVSRPLGELDDEVARIRLWLVVVALGGVLLAACTAVVIPGAALTPLEKLTETAEHVSRTGDLRRRIDVQGADELSRLAMTFNSMLEALEQAVHSQRQLVADASHELATPLTSIRTNVEVLLHNEVANAAERERLMLEVAGQLGEMSTLVGELVELARGDERPAVHEEVALDAIVEWAVERVRRDFSGLGIVAHVEPVTVCGDSSMLARAVFNLLENAAKWSPAGGPVEVSLGGGVLTVQDHGPGIAEEDLPRVFDRFYRAREARGTPGSGLGLAIVKQVAEAHGGAVGAESASGGGTLLRLALPLAREEPGDAGSQLGSRDLDVVEQALQPRR